MSSHRYSEWLGPILCGYFPGDVERIDRVLANARASVRLEPELIDGVQCFVVDAVAEHAAYTVWFAPERGYQILRMTRVQEGEYLRRLEQVARDEAPPVSDPDPDRWVRLTQTLHGVRLEQIDGKWIPVAGICTEELTHAEGAPSATVTTVERTRVELNPDFSDVSFAPNFTDGTDVRFVGEPNPIPHEWRDGKIIPREDEEATARLRAIVGGQRFTTDSAETSQFSLLRGPALFAAGAALITLAPAGLRRLRGRQATRAA